MEKSKTRSELNKMTLSELQSYVNQLVENGYSLPKPIKETFRGFRRLTKLNYIWFIDNLTLNP